MATADDGSEEKEPKDNGFDWKETVAVVFGFLGLLLVYGQLLATQESNRITQESNELSHRPWMIPDTISEIEPAGKGLLDLPTIKLMQTFKNAGSTPAVITSGVVSTAVFPPGRREKLIQIHQDIPTEAGECICPPGGEFQLPITVHMPSDEVLGMILASQLTFLIYGRVNYRDVFGKPRYTRWGMEFGHAFGAKWAEPRWITAGGDYNEIA